MKKLIPVVLVLALLCGCALAETVYVSISDDIGRLVMANAAVEATDVDGDGVLTLCDALYCAHEVGYAGGAAAGFAAADNGMGLSLVMLWGVDNGGSYGYYVNDVSALSLSDPISGGDHIRAYSYTDLETWSDTYSCFDRLHVETAAGESFELVLSAQSFDANWNTLVLPVADAVITVNGADSEFRTDAQGRAVLHLTSPGEYLISAHSDKINLVAPVCTVSVS